MAEADVEADVVSVNELFAVIWDSIHEYTPFLLILKVDKTVINRSFHHSCDRAGALADCLEHYLNNVCVGWTSAAIWENVAYALGKCGNAKRAEEIRQKLKCNEKVVFDGPSHESDYTGSGEDYTGYYSSMQAQQMVEASDGDVDYLKSSVTLHYNEAKRKFREYYFDVKEVLNNEEQEASDVLSDYKMQGEKQGNDVEICLNELLKRTSNLEVLFNDVTSKLSKGDCTAFPAMNKINDEYVCIEKLLAEALKQFEKYKNIVSDQTGDDSVAVTADIIHSLQAIMKLMTVQTLVHTDGIEVDEEEEYQVVRPITVEPQPSQNSQ